MPISLAAQPALILIDFQKGFEDIAYWGGARNNPEAERNAASLLNFWRENSLPLFHIQHCSKNPESRLAPGNPGNAFKDIVAPLNGEIIIQKNVNSAFIGTTLKQQLEEADLKSLIIAGLTTDHCVSTTSRMAGNYGFNTYIVSDATATFNKTGYDGKVYSAEIIHETALASLHQEFGTVVNTNQVIAVFK